MEHLPVQGSRSAWAPVNMPTSGNCCSVMTGRAASPGRGAHGPGQGKHLVVLDQRLHPGRHRLVGFITVVTGYQFEVAALDATLGIHRRKIGLHADLQALAQLRGPARSWRKSG